LETIGHGATGVSALTEVGDRDLSDARSSSNGQELGIIFLWSLHSYN
jgi:hypothetical protein